MSERFGTPDTAPATPPIRERLRLRLEREMRAAGGLLAGMPAFILASASPRRRELLAALGVTFDVHAADIPEIPGIGEAPEQFVARAAIDKAVHVASRHGDRIVLAADTVVAIGEEILGKPRDRTDARRMLESLSGSSHRVCTGVAVIAGGNARTTVVTSKVTFKAMTAKEIGAYVTSGEPFDKAGAYGIQSGGGRFVASVSGSYSNVIGLPVVETADLLSRLRGA